MPFQAFIPFRWLRRDCFLASIGRQRRSRAPLPNPRLRLRSEIFHGPAVWILMGCAQQPVGRCNVSKPYQTKLFLLRGNGVPGLTSVQLILSDLNTMAAWWKKKGYRALRSWDGWWIQGQFPLGLAHTLSVESKIIWRHLPKEAHIYMYVYIYIIGIPIYSWARESPFLFIYIYTCPFEPGVKRPSSSAFSQPAKKCGAQSKHLKCMKCMKSPWMGSPQVSWRQIWRPSLQPSSWSVCPTHGVSCKVLLVLLYYPNLLAVFPVKEPLR